MEPATIEGLLWIIVAATLAPILADIIPRVTVPVVVLEILIGILFGPEILGWIQHSEGLEIAKEFGVIFLFFLAGFEVDYAGIKGDPLRNALKGWGFSLAIFPLIAFSGMEKPEKRVNGNGEEEKVIESLPEMAVPKS